MLMICNFRIYGNISNFTLLVVFLARPAVFLLVVFCCAGRASASLLQMHVTLLKRLTR